MDTDSCRKQYYKTIILKGRLCYGRCFDADQGTHREEIV